MLRDPGCRRALCDAVGGAERLVLLGDVLELRERPLRDVLDDALPVLEAIGSALRGGPARDHPAEIVLLAGNHDHGLVEPWLRRRDRARPLGVDAEVAVGAGDPLIDVVGALSGGEDAVAGGEDAVAGREEALSGREEAVAGGQEAVAGGQEAVAGGHEAGIRVRVRYPGAWLGEQTWATHGHHVDRHTTLPILERLSAGAMARLTDRRDPRCAEDYEAVLAPVYGWIDALAEHGRSERGLEGSQAAWLTLSKRGGGVRRRALRAAFPAAIAAMNRAGVGPLRADLSGGALRRAPLVAIGEVLGRLGVGARWVVFGHTHRAGPLSGDDPGEWTTPAGAHLVNTGGWVRERGLLGADPAHSPYRPGWAAWIDGDAASAPELVNLLD